MSTAATLQSAVILDALNLLHNPGSVLEIRIPEPVTGYPLSGYFDNPAAAAKAAAAHSGKAAAVYVTLNPVAGDLLARSANRVKTVGRKGATTTDKEITRRRWFPIDFDPVRPAGISSTDAERDAALAKARAVRNWLAVCGWPAPVFADSGNGAHLLYRVDLPNDDRTKTLFERAMKVLASRFDCPEGTPLAVKVDTGVFNASRIWKLYGTLAAKGDSTETRPHRVAGIVERPESPDIVPVALIESLAGPVPSPTKEVPRQSTGDFFGEVNARALMSLGWVATLFPGATSYRDGYRVSSKALGRDLEEDLSIQPNGIKDFGLHDQGDANGGRRTPIDLVIEHGRQPDAKAAAIWLCRQMGLAPESLGWRKADPPHERAPQPRIESRANTAYQPPPPLDESTAWRGELISNNNGLIVKNHYNAVLIAENAYPGLIGFNDFAGRIEARTTAPWRSEPGPWTDYDTQELAFHIVKSPHNLPAFRIEMLEIAIQTAARRHKFNPAQDRLRSLAQLWDRAPRLETWLTTYLNAETNADNRAYLSELGSAFLKGVAARVMRPGCKRDDVLTLVGAQGFVKSGAAQAISDAILPDAFTDSLGNLGSDEAAIGIQGIILAEFGELSAIGRSELEAVKAFITRRSDRYRPKYARHPSDHPRTVSFIASTNEDCGFLRDPSGNRRWWPVKVERKIDLDALKKILPQLLGEATQRVLDGEPWHVTDEVAIRQAERIREDHSDSDVWESAVLNAATRLTDRERSISAILCDMGIELPRQDRAAQNRVSAILRSKGWKRRRGRTLGGSLTYLWERDHWQEPVVPISARGEQEGNSQTARQEAACSYVPICSPQKETNIKTHQHPSCPPAERNDGEKNIFIGNLGEQIGTRGTTQNKLKHEQQVNVVPISVRGEQEPQLSDVSRDAETLTGVLKFYRGWVSPKELSHKCGYWPESRVIAAAEWLVKHRRAVKEGGMYKPVVAERATP